MLTKDDNVLHKPEFLRGDGIKRVMADRPTSYEYADLLTCGRGQLFGPGNAQLPLPPMLMFERIASISEAGGAHGKGQIVAEDSPETLAKRLEGSMRFAVKVKGADPKEVVKAVAALKSVAEAHATHDGVEILSKGEEDARPAVAATIVKKSWDLLELRRLGMSLEDIFLQAVQNGKEAA